MADTLEGENSRLEVRSYFVRGRNALLARADFGDLFIDYYLHLAQHQILYPPPLDNLLKESLAALTLHCASRPWREITAWTINFQEPNVNLFVAGDNNDFGITGQLFEENVRSAQEGLFYADVISPRGEKRRSVVQFLGGSPFATVENFYAQSEQRAARYFQIGPEEFVLITAQPGCDVAWLEELDEQSVLTLDQTQTLSLLERRGYQWHCGCHVEKMMSFLSPAMQADPEDLFGPETSLRMSCPRCGARYTISREAMQAYLQKPK